ncbi:Hypothetical predicted protein [Scomber scombrus]|uniref:Secreted protein n=1 Tax=Scomber scombrus TaxID=13677 RepID=A0AAV1Q158_SCOSC
MPPCLTCLPALLPLAAAKLVRSLLYAPLSSLDEDQTFQQALRQLNHHQDVWSGFPLPAVGRFKNSDVIIEKQSQINELFPFRRCFDDTQDRSVGRSEQPVVVRSLNSHFS